MLNIADKVKHVHIIDMMHGHGQSNKMHLVTAKED